MKNSRTIKISAKEVIFEEAMIQMEFLNCGWIGENREIHPKA